MQIIDGTGASDNSVYVRPYDGEGDKDNFVTIFKETADAPLQHPDLLKISSYIWCQPYLALAPTWCFALATTEEEKSDAPIVSANSNTQDIAFDNHEKPAKPKDKAIGYILCAPSTLSLLSAWTKDYLPHTVAPSGEYPKPTVEEDKDFIPGEWDADRAMALRRQVWFPKGGLVVDGFPRLLEDYPAHLHIDIRAGYRRHGGGRALMDALFEKLRASKIKGIHLHMSASNTSAGRFYEAVGFRKFDTDLGGAEGGVVKNGCVTYVKKVE